MKDIRDYMTSNASNLSVVFVHLGAAKAKHLWLNIDRFTTLFPEIDLHLIIDQTSHLNNTKRLKCKVYFYDSHKSDNTVVGLLAHDESFRDGFWTYSMERIAALADWHEKNKNKRVLHIESDILVLPNFPFKHVSKIDSMAWTNVGPGIDCAALLYSPSYLNTRDLALSILKSAQVNNKLTDMSALYKFRAEHANQVKLLANGMENYEKLDLGGVFDSAAIGMWLLGQDPRNHYGWLKKHLFHSEAMVNPSLYSYSYDDKNQLRISKEGRSESLFNLHVHSKELKLFGRDWQDSLRSNIELSREKNPRKLNKIKVGILLDLVFDFFFRNGLSFKKVWKMIFEVRNRKNSI